MKRCILIIISVLAHISTHVEVSYCQNKPIVSLTISKFGERASATGNTLQLRESGSGHLWSYTYVGGNRDSWGEITMQVTPSNPASKINIFSSWTYLDSARVVIPLSTTSTFPLRNFYGLNFRECAGQQYAPEPPTTPPLVINPYPPSVPMNNVSVDLDPDLRTNLSMAASKIPALYASNPTIATIEVADEATIKFNPRYPDLVYPYQSRLQGIRTLIIRLLPSAAYDISPTQSTVIVTLNDLRNVAPEINQPVAPLALQPGQRIVHELEPMFCFTTATIQVNGVPRQVTIGPTHTFHDRNFDILDYAVTSSDTSQVRAYIIPRGNSMFSDGRPRLVCEAPTTAKIGGQASLTLIASDGAFSSAAVIPALATRINNKQNATLTAAEERGLTTTQTVSVSISQRTSVYESRGNLEVSRIYLAPNPTAENTTLSYQLASASLVTVEAMSILGQKIVLLSERFQAAGKLAEPLNLQHLPSGYYLVRLSVNGKIEATVPLSVLH